MVAFEKAVHMIRTYLLFSESGCLFICDGLSVSINHIAVKLVDQIKSPLIVDGKRKTKQSVKCMKGEKGIV